MDVTDASEGESESTWTKLSRRKVVQWGIAYVAGAWGLLQGIGFTADAFAWPSALKQIALLLLLIGLPIVLVLAWYHGDRGEQRVTRIELAILTLLFLLGGALFWRYDRASVESPAPPAAAVASATTIVETRPSTASATGTLPQRPSLAVLPFDSLGDSSANDYFADGMTDDIITDLSKLSGILVIARNSSATYKGKAVKVQQVAKDLGVRYVLEGSVRREGDTVRINAQLIDALGGQHLWAERYDGSIQDVFALQDRVIGQIVAALAVKLTHDERTSVEFVGTRNPQAYDAVLRGWAHYRLGPEEETNKAIALFEHAIALDPEYGRAHAALAAASWRIVQSTWESTTEGGYQRAFDRMQVALAKAMRQPNALAHAVSGEVFSKQGRYKEAFTEIGRAMALAPNDSDNSSQQGAHPECDGACRGGRGVVAVGDAAGSPVFAGPSARARDFVFPPATLRGGGRHVERLLPLQTTARTTTSH